MNLNIPKRSHKSKGIDNRKKRKERRGKAATYSQLSLLTGKSREALRKEVSRKEVSLDDLRMLVDYVNRKCNQVQIPS